MGKKEGVKYLKIIIFGLFFLIVLFAFYVLIIFPFIQNTKSIKTIPLISPILKHTINPTPTIKYIQLSLPIPKPQDWIRYQATCEPLKNHIDIYYPVGWFPKEFPYVRSGGAPDPSECEVLFGYPVQPASPQSHADGELAEFRISTWIDRSRNAKQYVEEDIQTWAKYLKKSPTPIIGEITINNKVFVTEAFGENDPYGNPRYITDINHRLFDIRLVSKNQLPSYNNSDGIGIFDSSRNIINSEFLNRLRIY